MFYRLFIALSVLLLSPISSFAAESVLIKVKDPQSLESYRSFPAFKKVRKDVFVAQLEKEEMNVLQRSSNVLLVEKNRKLQLFSQPNDLTSRLWGLKNSRGFDINALNAWKKTTGSKDVIVAIIDTGMDLNHPDLVDNLWINEAEKNGQPGVDDDGNGYVDDLHGWNFPVSSNEPNDTRGHGTHVAGIVGAKGNNGKGIVGANWDVSLMALNMFAGSGQAETSDAIMAIDYAVANGAKVINASWGAAQKDVEEEDFTLLAEAITRASDAGVTFVAASGNSRRNTDTTPFVPSSMDIPNIIAVGSMSRSGRLSSFSNYGKTTVDVVAPGSSIYSTYPGSYRSLSGTSMAAPFVAGIVALMLSVNPDLTPEEIRTILTDSCNPARALANRSVCGGYIDAAKALDKVPAL
ncbi:MAG: S8 family peptidase [Pseudomonadota bacterium]